MTTLADEIRQMLKQSSLTTAQIAAWVGCARSYVRAVKGRMNPKRASRERTADRAYDRFLRSCGDLSAANAAGRAAYRQAVLAGATIRKARALRTIAIRRVLKQTANKQHANAIRRAAYREVRRQQEETNAA